ncbi:MAG: efflux RND transporter periplasmic adaptor subunit [Longimicrobiales bacterium]
MSTTTMTIERAVALSVMSLMMLMGTGCSQQQGAATTTEERPIVLGAEDVATVTKTRLTSGVVLTGSLEPAWRVSVKAQVPGTLRSLNADRGTRLTAGQVMATIEALGIVGAAESARAGVAAAEANVAVARQRMESARALRDAGALSEIDFKTAQAAFDAAEAQLAGARAQAAGALEQAERATVRAPMAGVVSNRIVQQGEAVSPGDELFTVVRSDVLELAGQVPVDAATQIRPGQAVVFTVSAQPGREFRGQVARIEPVANPGTRQVGVYLRMNNPGGVIGGQFATGRVLGATGKEVTVIPETAVRTTGATAYVFVVNNNSVARRTVTLGELDQATGLVVVLSGLQSGEQVVTTSSAAFVDGARVQVGTPVEPAGVKAREN